MSTKQQKRETRQARIHLKYHKILKVTAFNRGMTISRLLDEVIEDYFGIKGEKE
jgi:hypothetical protein